MTFDISEEGEPCDFCGKPVEFIEDDWVRCTTCGAEYSNMDYTGDVNIEVEVDSTSDVNIEIEFEVWNIFSKLEFTLLIKWRTDTIKYQLNKVIEVISCKEPMGFFFFTQKPLNTDNWSHLSTI